MMKSICASAQVLLVVINTVASVLDLFSLSSYIVQLCQHWTSASLINNQQSLSSDAPSRLRISDVISYFCILQSPLPALISRLAGNKVTHTLQLLLPFRPQINELKYQQMGSGTGGSGARGLGGGGSTGRLC